MDFSTYIRTRRGYTETGYVLRQALLGLPDTVQTPGDLHAWLAEREASLTVRLAAAAAVASWRDMLRQQARRRAAKA